MCFGSSQLSSDSIASLRSSVHSLVQPYRGEENAFKVQRSLVNCHVLFKFTRTLALKMGFDPYTSDPKVFTRSVLQGHCPGSGYLHSLRAQSIAIRSFSGLHKLQNRRQKITLLIIFLEDQESWELFFYWIPQGTVTRFQSKNMTFRIVSLCVPLYLS